MEKPAFCWLKGRSDHKVCTKSPTSITFLVCCRHGPFLSCWEIESGWFTKPNLPPLPPRIFFWKVRSCRSLPEEGPPLLLTPTQGSYPEMIDFKDICLSHRNDFLRKLAIKQWCTDFYMSKSPNMLHKTWRIVRPDLRLLFCTYLIRFLGTCR